MGPQRSLCAFEIVSLFRGLSDIGFALYASAVIWWGGAGGGGGRGESKRYTYFLYSLSKVFVQGGVYKVQVLPRLSVRYRCKGGHKIHKYFLYSLRKGIHIKRGTKV